MNLREKYKPVLETLEGLEEYISDEDIEAHIPDLELALRELKNCASCTSPLICKNSFPGYWYGLNKATTKYYQALKFTYIECKSAPERKRAIRLEALIESSGMKEGYKNKTFDNFQVDKDNKKAYEVCKQYAANFGPSSGNLFLYSDKPGTGKTHLACAITNELLKRFVISLFVVVPELLNEMSAKVGRNEDVFGMVQEIMDVPFLVLDDLGKEKITDWRKEQLYIIINDRVASNKPMVITTNCSIKELEKRLDPATVSRIVENSKVIELNGPDRRFVGIQERLFNTGKEL